MVISLLEDMYAYLKSGQSESPQGRSILQKIEQVLPSMRRQGDAEYLPVNEVMVRICPDTGHPVLVCHDGEGQCACLHNETLEEDATDVKLWLSSLGKECNGNRKLLETVVDLAYNAGADNLWENRDSRAVNAGIIRWAEVFEAAHAGTDWDEKDYLLAIDAFYKEKKSDL